MKARILFAALLGLFLGSSIPKADAGPVWFYRDSSVPALGEAWRDESGMIWGDLAPRYMTQYEAASYCKSMGAQLPDRGDFFRLRKYLGGGGEFEGLDGYRPQILPHLYYKIPDCCGGERDQSYDYWSSSVYPGDCKYAAAFAGLSGSMPVVNRGTPLPVRCVVQR